MNYNETVDWMFSQLPMYQHQGASAFRKDLTNTILLADHLGNPEKKIVCIHVAGTNGKGSTSHMIASILQEAGYKVGLYTSPHLKDFRERIKINGQKITKAFVTTFVKNNKKFFEIHNLSFFEMTVGLAFNYFDHEKVDIAVIEVGMGGRLDSTNIINPLISVITNIGLDHLQFLGDTLPLIASEKAGIIKSDTPVIIGQYHRETIEIFKEIALEKKAPLFFAFDQPTKDFDSPLLGNYQVHNRKTALKCIDVIQELGQFKIDEQHIKYGLANVIRNTGLMGRWQQLQANPLVICDTAHNYDGLEIVLAQVKSQNYVHLHIVIGVVNDKDLREILALFPKNATYYFCRPDIPRGLDAEQLRKKAEDFNLIGLVYNSVTAAYEAAKRNANHEDLIFIGGSTFVVAEIL